MFNWIAENKEWVFSGLGVAIITIVVSFLVRSHNQSNSQRQSSGDHSTNIQMMDIKNDKHRK